MPNLARQFDPVFCQDDQHGVFPWLIHFTVAGMFTSGSDNVFCNGLPAVRVNDGGIHVACSGPNTFVASSGSPNVFINNRAAVRSSDETIHCGNLLSKGEVLAGMTSPNTLIN
jgi:uncharacterized Zn-binding protein involved in type VI secretion